MPKGCSKVTRSVISRHIGFQTSLLDSSRKTVNFGAAVSVKTEK